MISAHLTAIILTYNESDHIADCLQSAAFADRVLVFDSMSTDDTQAIAREHGAVVIEHPFSNYAAQRNAALDAVAGETDWVLFVDADERVSGELATEVRAKIGAAGDYAGYRIPRHNYIFGVLTRVAGWFPDYQTRLLRVGKASYDADKLVHEVVLLEGSLGTLENPFIHYNYESQAQFHSKQRRYSRYDAEILHKNGERLKPWTLITMPLHHFRWRFLSLKGYRQGWHGLYLSVLMARYEFRKYWLLGALNRGQLRDGE
ncbi:MAG: glycosyltransferase family 2 protein [Chloroflexota bacterium]